MYMCSQEIGKCGDKCGSAEKRANQNTGLELEVQNKDLLRKMLEDFVLSQEETGFPLL